MKVSELDFDIDPEIMQKAERASQEAREVMTSLLQNPDVMAHVNGLDEQLTVMIYNAGQLAKGDAEKQAMTFATIGVYAATYLAACLCRKDPSCRAHKMVAASVITLLAMHGDPERADGITRQ